MALNLAYNMQVKTRYQYVHSSRRIAGSLKRVALYMNFEDTDGLTMTVSADGTRFSQPIPYTEERQSGRSATGATGYRHVLQFDIKEDVFGDFFDFLVSKVVPSTGVVEYEGIMFEVEPFEREAEFSTGY
jgi:hypothetical protein